MSDTHDRSMNPIFGDQPFKIGLFAYLHEGGMALTKAPQRWKATWSDIAAMARMADEGGMDFLVPISSWKGWRGEIDQRRWSYETLTHAAALAGITRRIGLFSTVHAPLIPPVMAAKALATIDHASGGRAGVNIVCGWNEADNAMFGVTGLPHDERYAHGYEWWDIVTRLLVEGDKEFDYNGKYFQLKSVSGEPGSIQQPHPAIISAAYSPVGRDFAIKTSDFILTMFSDFDSAVQEVQDIRDREAKAGRAGDPLGLIGTVSITCRESRDEAEAFNHYYAVEQRDEIAVEQFVTARTANAASPYNDVEKMKIGAAGGGAIVGTPEDVVERLVQLRDAGFAGATLTTLNFLEDLPLIVNRVLPLMEEAGLRKPSLKNAA